jgi:hypothetical protein
MTQLAAYVHINVGQVHFVAAYLLILNRKVDTHSYVLLRRLRLMLSNCMILLTQGAKSSRFNHAIFHAQSSPGLTPDIFVATTIFVARVARSFIARDTRMVGFSDVLAVHEYLSRSTLSRCHRPSHCHNGILHILAQWQKMSNVRT